jgi:hypothetical protein
MGYLLHAHSKRVNLRKFQSVAVYLFPVLNATIMLKLLKKLFLLMPIFLGIALLNYREDPAGIFKEAERNMAEILLSGRNVANLKDWDERLCNKYVIEKDQLERKVLILGSSRSYEMRDVILFGKPFRKFFNHSMGGATIEDHIAIYELCHARRLKPRLVVLNLDVWMLNIDNGQKRWQSLKPEYDAASLRLGLPFERGGVFSFKWRKWLEMFSPAYFQRSLHELIKNQLVQDRTRKTNYYATDEDIVEVAPFAEHSFSLANLGE